MHSGTRFPFSSTRASQRGITLLESLVSLLILAIAVLGQLGVQLRTQAETQTGVRRAQAIRLTEDFAERIKSNPEGFAQLASGRFDSGWNSSPTPVNDCRTVPCTAQDLAAWDVATWKKAVKETLPLGQASISASTEEAAEAASAGAAAARRQLGVMVAWRANERFDTDEYAGPLSVQVDDRNGAGASCPAGLVCHLAYVQP